MRKTLDRLARRVAAFRRDATHRADFNDVAGMVIAARALRANGYPARFSATPLRLVVTAPKFVEGTR